MKHYKVVLSVILVFLLIFSQITPIFAEILSVTAAIIDKTDNYTKVRATVTSDVYRDLQDGAASVSYSVYRDEENVGYDNNTYSVGEVVSVGGGVYSRDYEFTVDKDDYSLNGDYSAVVSAVYGGDCKVDEVDIFGIDSYDDGSEYNTATTIYENIEYNKAIDFSGDKDYFKFIPTLSGGYCIETFGSTNTTGELTETYMSNWGYWVSNIHIIDYNSGNSNNFKIQYQLEAGKEYYIKVYHSYYYSTGDYTLKITKIQNDHGDGYDSASEVFEDQEVQGSIQFIKNQDYFSFTLAQDGDYTIRQLSGINCNAYLYDNNGNWQNWGDGSKNNFEIIHQLKSGQTYNVMIKAVEQEDTGTYSFKIQKLTKIKGIISLPADAPANEAKGIRVFAENENYISSTYAYNYPYYNNYLNIDNGQNSVAYAVYVPEETGFTVKLTTWDNRYEGELYYGLDSEVQSLNEAAQIDTSFGEMENINIELKSKKCISGSIALPKYMDIKIVASNNDNTFETWVYNYEDKETVSYSVYVSKDEGYTVRYVLPDWSSLEDDYLSDYYYSSDGMVKDLELATRLDMRENHIENINLQLVPVIKVTGVEINKEKVDVMLGRSESILAQVTPSNASYPEIEWTSLNSYIASVDSSGKVNGNALGTTKVRAWSVSNQVYFADCEVNVIPVPVTGIDIDKNELILEETTSEQLTASILPADATNKNVIWSSADANIATVSQNGLVKAVSKGTTTIRASSVADSVYDEEYNDECSVTVIELQPRSISGIISLPDGEVAPEGGLNLSVSASVYADQPGTAIQLAIPEGNNSVEYTINNLLPQIDYYVYYNIDFGKGYNPKGYYGENGTQVNSSSSNLIRLDSNAVDINLTLIKDDHGNDFSTATTIQENVELQSKIDYVGDKDYFQFTLESDGVYIVETKDSSIDMYGYLYDSNQNLIDSDDDGGSGVNFSIAYEMKAGESYYIRAERLGNYGTGNYTLVVNKAEDDFGNSFESASDIELEKEYAGTINYNNDNDYFTFVPESDGYYYIKRISGDYCYTYLYDENQNYLNYNYGFGIKYELKVGKRYYLKVYSSSIRDYGFKIERMKSVKGTISLPDGADSTNSINNISICANNNNYNTQCTVSIPQGQSSVAYTVYVPADDEYKISFYVSDYKFVSNGYYSESGTVRDSNDASFIDVYEDADDINLVLEPKKVITGTISLPEGETASSIYNINVYASNGIFDGNSYISNKYKYIYIPNGKSSVAYSVYVPENEGYTVKYAIEGSSGTYESDCYYSQNGTVSFENQADKIDVGEDGINDINLTLKPQRQIGGTVSLPKGISDNIWIDIYLNSSNCNYSGSLYLYGGKSTNFTFNVKADTDYKLRYSVYHNMLDTNMYYSDTGAVKDESNAVLLDVTDGSITYIDFVISARKAIKGTIALPDGEIANSDINNIRVEVSNDNYPTYYQYVDILEGQNSVSYSVYVPADENYTVKYIVGSSYGYESGYYYSDSGMVQDKADAAKFIVDGQNIENINLELVKHIDVEEVILSENEITLSVGDEQQLIAAVLPENATNKNIYWISDNTSIASVSSDGVITALRAGTTKIKVVSLESSSIFAECLVNITEDSLKLNASSINMKIGEIKALIAQAILNEEEYTDIVWSSSNESIATVSQDGSVEAKAEGTAIIKAECKDSSDIYAECIVNVYENLVTIDAVEWEVNEELRSYYLKSITYGNGIFVGVGESGVIRTSEDGVTWINQNLYSNVDFNKVIWNGNQFVAIGDFASILVSDDGENWTIVNFPNGDYFNGIKDIIWNGYMYIAVGDNGTILNSIDGNEWTKNNLDDLYFMYNFTSVTWNGTYFIAISREGIFKSSNGIDWEKFYNELYLDFSEIMWTGKTFIGIYQNELYKSYDGIEWERVLWTETFFEDLYCDSNNYYALGEGDKIYVSSDGEEWEAIELNQEYTFKDIISNENKIVSIGYNGDIHTSQDYIYWNTYKVGLQTNLKDIIWTGEKFIAIGNNNNKIITSTDGVNWSKFEIEDSGFLNAIAYGNDRYIIVDEDGKIFSSVDGKAWSYREYDNSLYDIAFNGEKFVACGEDVLLISEDGENWTEEYIRYDIYLKNVIWDGNKFIASGSIWRDEGGIIVTSTDGVNWTITPLEGIVDIYSIASNGSNYVINGLAVIEKTEYYSRYSSGIFYSSDLINWYKTSENINFDKVEWDGRNFVGIENMYLYYSGNGEDWESKYLGTNVDVNGIAWDGEKYILVGEQGSIITGLVQVERVEVDKSKISIVVNDTKQMEAKVYPLNALNKNISWSSLNPDIATVSDTGLVTAVGEGTATIRALSESNPQIFDECEVTVNPIEVSRISLNKTTTNIQEGNTEQLTAVITPDNATNKNIIWTSNNTDVATVSDTGLVTAVGEGETTITAISESNLEVIATCTITVTAMPV